ncbi:hypothetical protein P3T21_007749, partial [Paraburkholderia sp. GAS334]
AYPRGFLLVPMRAWTRVSNMRWGSVLLKHLHGFVSHRDNATSGPSGDACRPVSVARRPYFSMSAHRLAADTSADYATRSATDPGAKTMKRQDQLTAPERTSTAVTQCCLDRSGNRPATVLDQTGRLLRCNRSMFKSGARSSWRGERTLSPFCHRRRSPLALQKCYCRGGRRLRIFRYAWKGD